MKFSVIIPAKNESRNLPLCLEALRHQSIPQSDFEVVVIDNGSTDGSPEVVRKYGFSVQVQPHLSLSGLRNFGASLAKGEILAFLDADCVVARDWLESAAKVLQDPDVGCTGSTPVAPSEGTWVERVWSSFRTRRKASCRAEWINSSNLFVRRNCFEAVGGFNERVTTCEDVDICMRLNRICCVLFDPKIKVVHLGEPKTVMAFFKKEIWRGKGTISGIHSHGIRRSELKSILLPLYYLVLLVGLLLSLLVRVDGMMILIAALYCLPSILFTGWVVRETRQHRYIFGYFILFLLYANARMVAIVRSIPGA